MVCTAATAHGVFVELSPAGKRLARVQDLGPSAGDCVYVFPGRCGHAAQVLEKIERCPLRCENGPHGTSNGGDPPSRLNLLPIMMHHLDLNIRVQSLERP